MPAADRQILVLFGVLALALLGLAVFLGGFRPSIKTGALSSVSLPPGFRIATFADGLGGSPVSIPGPNPGPRMMAYLNGTLLVTIPSQGRVVALPDSKGNWKADQVITFMDGLNNPSGIDVSGGWVYIAEEDKVIRVTSSDGLHADLAGVQPLLDLPTGGHFTRTVKVQDGKLFVSVGSTCNVCLETDPRRAAITRCDIDGRNCSLYARGLRNAVGIVFHPLTGELYATDNGRDLLGNDLPPDEINLVRPGGDYGWPTCYGKNVHDTDFDKNVYVRDPCQEPDKIPSLIDLPAHSAPLGLAFYYGDNFPKEYRGNLFVAYHGSWNRDTPTGYKIVRVDLTSGQVSDFATGWLQGVNVLGRPVDLLVAPDGSLLVSDDNAGAIYRIDYRP